ncbi:10313_t:CDS:2, partial [Diversispora eburnea]
IIQSYSNEITNESVKTILKRHGYFEDTQVLAETLKPIRAAIQITESKDTTMADCYINLIKIASAIKDLSSEDYQDFRNHCIKVFNERFKEFTDDVYLLTYLLHPQFK